MEEVRTWGEFHDYLKETGSCSDICPFYRLGDCDMEQGKSVCGEYYEPPCVAVSYPNDKPLDEIYNTIHEHRAKAEAKREAREEAERQRSERAKKAAETRRKQRIYCFNEIQTIKHIKAQILSVKNAASFAESLAFAVNITNEMFSYNDRVKPSSALEEQLAELNKELALAEQAYENKKAEFKAFRKEVING